MGQQEELANFETETNNPQSLEAAVAQPIVRHKGLTNLGNSKSI